MKSNKIYYSSADMSILLGIDKTTVNYRLRKLSIKPCFLADICNGFVKPYYSIEKFNLIAKIAQKTDNFEFIMSNFDNATQTFVEFQSKINNNGFL